MICRVLCCLFSGYFLCALGLRVPTSRANKRLVLKKWATRTGAERGTYHIWHQFNHVFATGTYWLLLGGKVSTPFAARAEQNSRF